MATLWRSEYCLHNCRRVAPELFLPKPFLVTFAAGSVGAWRIQRITAINGGSLANAERLAICEGAAPNDRLSGLWTLRGTTSNTRYTTRAETGTLVSKQESLARSVATRAVLIPIRKTDAWWAMAQDERRAVFEEQSRHIAIGLDYLPAVARRLHHSRDLGEPFDFLTWFEFAPNDESAFDHMLARLRETAEWGFVEREVEVRLTRDQIA